MSTLTRNRGFGIDQWPSWAARWLGYRSSPPKPEPQLVAYFWSFVASFCALGVLQAIFGYASYFQARHVPSVIGSFVSPEYFHGVLCFAWYLEHSWQKDFRVPRPFSVSMSSPFLLLNLARSSVATSSVLWSASASQSSSMSATILILITFDGLPAPCQPLLLLSPWGQPRQHILQLEQQLFLLPSNHPSTTSDGTIFPSSCYLLSLSLSWLCSSTTFIGATQHSGLSLELHQNQQTQMHLPLFLETRRRSNHLERARTIPNRMISKNPMEEWMIWRRVIFMNAFVFRVR